jgi:hypothetical protein
LQNKATKYFTRISWYPCGFYVNFQDKLAVSSYNYGKSRTVLSKHIWNHRYNNCIKSVS